MHHGYELYDLETGAKNPAVYDVDATDSTIAVYALDGSLGGVYPARITASALTDTTVNR